MEKILTQILFEIFGRLVAREFLKNFVLKLIKLGLDKLIEKKFFKDEKTEKAFDELLLLVEVELCRQK